MSTDQHYMQRCLQLAEMGLGHVGSNPMVGSVVVCDGKIIGEGYHQQFGCPHAEVNAINSVADQHMLCRSTLYVNLEPCSHTGKTPPCSTFIIEKKIPSLVIGMKDPFPKVNGAGIVTLENAGIKVTVGVLEEECKELNKRFLCAHTKNRPYLILKWAQSADGFTGRMNERLQISNESSKVYTHKWRSEEMAIMIGANTACVDDPKLDVRLWKGKNPIKIIIDRSGVLQNNTHLKILNSEEPTYIFTTSKLSLKAPNQVIKISNDGSFMNQVFYELKNLGITSCFVEGGSTLHQLLIQENL
ncbi:MAG: bifunctional diaminohydroxyphosphoribosylaminopyrimidine deaminase/5-amino-6-(5-phosphoribosylamino)uracil reductase RibD, partial [Bdellovibrionales bacterium]